LRFGLGFGFVGLGLNSVWDLVSNLPNLKDRVPTITIHLLRMLRSKRKVQDLEPNPIPNRKDLAPNPEIFFSQRSICSKCIVIVDTLSFRFGKERGSISDEIGPLEKFDFFHVKLSHKVLETVH
jgi:hypothetical protein